MFEYQKNLNGTGLKIGIVEACFSEEIGDQLLQACLTRLQELGVQNDDIAVAKVPGALEIPVTLQSLAARQEFDALIAIGVVIRGETYHFELVANESAAGVSAMSLDYNIPIANAILTTENEEQALARTQIKGQDAAEVAVQMANLIKKLTITVEEG